MVSVFSILSHSSESAKTTIIPNASPYRLGSIEIVNNEIYVVGEPEKASSPPGNKAGVPMRVYDLQGTLLRTIPIPGQVDFYLRFVVLPDERIALLDNRNDRIYFINSTGDLLAITKMLDEPDSHAQDLDGVIVGNKLIFSEDGDRHLLQIDLDTYESSVFKDLTSVPIFIARGPMTFADGQYYIVGSRTVSCFVQGGEVTRIADVPDGNITGIVVLDGYAYVSINRAGKIYKVNLSTGESTVYATGLNYPEDLEVVIAAKQPTPTPTAPLPSPAPSPAEGPVSTPTLTSFRSPTPMPAATPVSTAVATPARTPTQLPTPTLTALTPTATPTPTETPEPAGTVGGSCSAPTEGGDKVELSVVALLVGVTALGGLRRHL